MVGGHLRRVQLKAVAGLVPCLGSSAAPHLPGTDRSPEYEIPLYMSYRFGSVSVRISRLNITENSSKSSLSKIVLYSVSLKSSEIGTAGLVW